MTSSRLRAFRTCPRLHHYRYELCRRPARKGNALTIGTIFHCGLEAWWRAWKAKQESSLLGAAVNPLNLALEAISEAYFRVTDDVDEYDHLKMIVLMRGYDARWSDEMNHIRVVAVEKEFVGPLVNPDTGHPSRTYQLAGKIDVIIETNGAVFLVEHKTTSLDIQPEATYWTKLRMDPQVSTYHRGGEILGHTVAGTLYDVIRKPSLRPLSATPEASRKTTKGKKCKLCKNRGHTIPDCHCNGSGWEDAPRLYAGQREQDETPEEYALRIADDIAGDPNKYYQRGDVIRLDSELIDHARDTWLSSKAIREAELAGSHPRNPDACERYNRFCEYWMVCTGMASIDDDSRFRDAEQHSELTAA